MLIVDVDMAEEQVAAAAPQNWALKTLEHIGEGTVLAQQIFDMIGHSKFFSDFTRNDIQLLAKVDAEIYRAEPGRSSAKVTSTTS
ncbi:MAG: hypothetical protein KIT73_09110 [Burkholderiales bacterium]|nr:hypothetical protein [Burkholderiales bacterium]